MTKKYTTDNESRPYRLNTFIYYGSFYYVCRLLRYGYKIVSHASIEVCIRQKRTCNVKSALKCPSFAWYVEKTIR